MKICVRSAGILILVFCVASAGAAEWPSYGGDNDNGFYINDSVSFPLGKSWVAKQLPPSKAYPINQATDGDSEMQPMFFDYAPSPIVVSNRVYYNTTTEEAIYCMDADTGDELWRFHAEGAVRMAPAYDAEKIYFGSDDGYVYCLDAADGSLVWKTLGHTNTPTRAMMYRRMTSLWPVRTDVVVDDGRVYFGCGMLPPNGTYLNCVDADTGTNIWRTTTSYPLVGHVLVTEDRVWVGPGRTFVIEYQKSDGAQISQDYDSNRDCSGPVSGRVGGLEVFGPGELGTVMIRGSTESADAWYDNNRIRVSGCVPLESRRLMTDGETLYFLHGQEERFYSSPPKALMAVSLAFATNELYLLAQDATARFADTSYGQFDYWYGGTKNGAACSEDELMCNLYSARVWAVTNQTTPDICALLTPSAVIVGGTNTLAAYNPTNGASLWSVAVSGTVYELAYADGKLLAGTDIGYVYCFTNNAAGSVDESAPTYSSPYPTNDADYDLYAEAAQKAVDSADTTKGYCLVLGAGEGRLAYEIAQRSEYFIVGLETDPAKAAAARTNLTQTGLYGTRIVIHSDMDDLFPHPDYFANLITSEELLIDGSMPYSSREIFRMLQPYGGTMFFGNRDGELDLETWEHSEISAWSNVASVEGCAYKTASRGDVEGFGDWRFQMGNPGNTFATGDRKVKQELHTQWIRQYIPDRIEDRHALPNSPLVHNGYLVINGEDILCAADAFNGTKLWELERPATMKKVASQDTHDMCMLGDTLYAASSNVLYTVDMQTGSILFTNEGPIASEEWGYVGVYSNKLIASKQKMNASARVETSPTVLYRGATSEFNVVVSHTLFADDPDTGANLWTYSNGYVIVNSTIALGDTNVYFIEFRNSAATTDPDGRVELRHGIASDAYLVAVDIENGNTSWAVPFEPYATNQYEVSLWLSYASDRLVAVGTYWTAPYDSASIAYYTTRIIDPADGSILFTVPNLQAVDAKGGSNTTDHNMATMRPVFTLDRAIFRGYGYKANYFDMVNLTNGAHTTRTFVNDGAQKGCMPPVASHDHMYYRSMMTDCTEIESGYTKDITLINRPSCWPTIVPANGLLVMPEGAHNCDCGHPEMISLAMAPNEEGDEDEPIIFGVNVLNDTNLVVLFSEAVSTATAENVANYIITNASTEITVQSAERQADHLERVLLTVSSMGLDYYDLTASDIEDLYGNPMSSPMTTNFWSGTSEGMEVSTNRLAVSEGSTNTFQVRLAEQPDATSTVTVSRVSGDADLSVSIGATLYFTTNNWDQWQTVTIAAAQDLDWIAGTALVRCAMAAAPNSDITVTEVEDDTFLQIQVTTNALTVPENGSSNFQVRLSAQPFYTTTVNVSRVSGDTDITISSSTNLVYTTGDWDQWQTVTLDAAEDPDELHGSATIRCAAGDMADVDVTATEKDNDNSIVVSTTSLGVPEGSTNVFGVRMNTNPGTDTTVTVSRIAGDTDIAVGAGSSLVFDSGNWDAYQFVRLDAANDPDDVNGVATIRCVSVGLDDVDVTATEIDDDDVTLPYLVSLTVISDESLSLLFSEAMDETTAETAANYIITNGISVNSATLGADTQTVMLSIGELPTGLFTLIVTNVEDLAGNPIGNTATNFSWTRNDPMAYEPFTYAVGDIGGNNGGTGWTNAWSANTNFMVINPGEPLVYSNAAAGIVIDGGNRALKFAGTPDVAQISRGTTNIAQDVYFSFLVKATNWGFGYNEHLGVGRSDGNNDSAVFFGRKSSGTTEDLGGAEAAGTYVEFLSEQPTIGQTYMFVGKFVWGSTDFEQTHVWINPTSSGAEQAQFYTNVTNVGENWLVGGISMWDVFTDSGVFEPGDDILFDELRIGTNWASVVAPDDTASAEILLSAASVSVPEGSTNGFQVKLTLEPAAPTTVTVSRASGDTDISVTDGSSLVFNASNWDTWQNVELTAAQDPDWFVGTAIVRCAASGLADKDVTATETEDDVAIDIELSTNALEVIEGSTNIFNVRLSGEPAAATTVTVARISGDTDLSVDMGASRVFLTNTWDQWQTVSLAAAEDPDEASSSAVFRCSATYIAPQDVTATENDNDVTLTIELSTTSVTVPEGSTNIFTVRLSNDPVTPRTVTVSRIWGDTDITVDLGSELIFTTGDWDQWQTVSLAAAEDNADEVDGVATIQCAAVVMSNVYVTATESDNDDLTAPWIVSVSALNDTTVRIIFSEPLDETTAETAGNYTITNGNAVSGAALGADTVTVTLTLAQMSAGEYGLQVASVEDLAGNPVASGTATNFTFAGTVGLIAYDGFDYADGSAFDGLNGGTGWSDTWQDTGGDNTRVTTNGMSYTNLQVQGNKLFMDRAVDDSQKVRRYMATNGCESVLRDNGFFGKDGSAIWLSFMVQHTNANTQGREGIGLLSNTTFVVDIGRDGNGQVRGIGDIPNGTYSNDNEVTLWYTTFLVAKYSFKAGADDVYLWVNPNPTNSEPDESTADASWLGYPDIQFDGIEIWSGAGAGSTSVFDEVRIGGTWESVTPTESAGGGDRDGDGIPDDYEEQYGGGPTNLDAEADLDGDGLSNFQEYIANCDPTNDLSALVIDLVQPDVQGSNYVIAWQSASNRIYCVSWMTNLFSISLEPMASNLPATPPQNIWTDTTHGAEQKGFYRIDVRIE